MTERNPVRDRIAEAVIAVAVTAGGWWMIARPAHERAARAESRLIDAETARDTREATDIPDPQRAHLAASALDTWSAELSDPLRASTRLQHAADTAGVRIERLAPTDESEPATHPGCTTRVRRFELVASGPGASMARLLDLIAETPLTTVRSFELAPGNDGADTISVVMIEVSSISIAVADDPEADR